MQLLFIEPVNKFPDCVFLKLKETKSESIYTNGIQPTNGLILLSNNHSLFRQVDLILTIRFGEEEINVVGGTVKFGLRRGVLELKLQNCKIPLETTDQLVAPFSTTVETALQKEKGTEFEGGTSVSVTGGITAKSKDANKTVITIKYLDCQIEGGGTETEPTWKFVAKTGEMVLKGLLKEGKLGTLNVKGSPCWVETTFVVKDQVDIHLIEASGIWSKEISRNKTAILERKLFLRHISPKLQPFLSRAEVRCE